MPLRYVLKRLGTYVLTLFAAFTVVFLIAHLAPGDPIRALLTQMSLRGQQIPGGDELVKAYKEMFGLDGSLFDQYIRYVTQLLRGNLGVSIAFFPTPVWDLIRRALPWTVGLLLITVIVSWVLGNFFGAIVGWGKDTKAKTVLSSLCLVLSRIPYPILALVLILLFTYYLPIFPTSGAMSMGTVPNFSLSFIFQVIRHGMLPALSIIIVSLGGWLIGMRSLLINIKGEDYLLFAKAKGLRDNTILMRYAVRNALLPQMTGLAMTLGRVVSGAIVTEAIFAYPGIGNLYMTALGLNDYNLIQGMTVIIIFAVLTANLLIDMLYPLIDPRIRYGGK